MYVTCKIPGRPQGKGRPRFTMQGHAYTPERTVQYEKLIRDEYMKQCGHRFGDTEPLEMSLVIRFAPPRAATKKMREDMLAGLLRPTKKPDTSNIIKAVEDALNDVAYRDDCQIIRLTAEKVYSDDDGIEVSISSRDSEGAIT